MNCVMTALIPALIPALTEPVVYRDMPYEQRVWRIDRAERG